MDPATIGAIISAGGSLLEGFTGSSATDPYFQQRMDLIDKELAQKQQPETMDMNILWGLGSLAGLLILIIIIFK